MTALLCKTAFGSGSVVGFMGNSGHCHDPDPVCDLVGTGRLRAPERLRVVVSSPAQVTVSPSGDGWVWVGGAVGVNLVARAVLFLVAIGPSVVATIWCDRFLVLLHPVHPLAITKRGRCSPTCIDDWDES